MHFVLVGKDNNCRVMAGSLLEEQGSLRMKWPALPELPEELFTAHMLRDPSGITPAMITNEADQLVLSDPANTDPESVKALMKDLAPFRHMLSEGKSVTAKEFAAVILQYYDSPAAQAVADRLRTVTKKATSQPYPLFTDPSVTHAGGPGMITLPLFTQEQIHHLRDAGAMEQYDAVTFEHFMNRHRQSFTSYGKGFTRLFQTLPPELALELDDFIQAKNIDDEQRARFIRSRVKEDLGWIVSDLQIENALSRGAWALKQPYPDLETKLEHTHSEQAAVLMARHLVEHNTENAYIRTAEAFREKVASSQDPQRMALLMASSMYVTLSHHPMLQRNERQRSQVSAYWQQFEHYTNAMAFAPPIKTLPARVLNTLTQEGYDNDLALLALSRGHVGLSDEDIKRLPNMGEFGLNELTRWREQHDAVQSLNDAVRGIMQNPDSVTEGSTLIGALRSVVSSRGETQAQRLALTVTYALSTISSVRSVAPSLVMNIKNTPMTFDGPDVAELKLVKVKR